MNNSNDSMTLENILNELNNSITNNISQSVLDLISCFICMGSVKSPISCPKCLNFACKSCLKAYFGNNLKKNCPVCKAELYFSDFKENKIIVEIERILKNSPNERKEGFEKLSSLFIENKNYYERNANIINDIKNKTYDFQKNIRVYKEEFINFISKWHIIMEKAFDNYLKKTEDLINLLSNFKKSILDLVKNYEILYDNNKKNLYDNNDNLKNLIKEIFLLERKGHNLFMNFNNQNLLKPKIIIKPFFKKYDSSNDFKLKKTFFFENKDNTCNCTINGFDKCCLKIFPKNLSGENFFLSFTDLRKNILPYFLVIIKLRADKESSNYKLFKMIFSEKKEDNQGITYTFKGKINLKDLEETKDFYQMKIEIFEFYVKL